MTPVPEEPKATETESFLNNFSKALSRIKLYSFQHPMAKEILQQSYDSLAAALSALNELNFSLAEKKLLLNGSPILNAGAASTILGLFQRYQIQSITFKKDISLQEFTSFLQAVTARESESSTNLKSVLEKSGIQNIQLDSAFYAKVSEGTSVSGYSKGGSGAGTGTGNGVAPSAAGEKPSQWYDKISEMPLEAALWELTQKSIQDPSEQKRIYDLILKQLNTELDSYVQKATEPLRKEKQVVVNEQIKTKSVLDNQAEGVIVVDETGKIVMLNPAAEKMFGESLSDIRGKDVQSLSKQELMITMAKNISSHVSDEQSKEVSVQSSEYVQNLIKSSTATIQNPEGKVVGFVSMLQDIAKQKELQRMQEDFIGNVTHELRSPLTSIKAALATLDDDSGKTVSPQQQQILSIAGRNIDRLARLINDLLDTTKISAGKMTINPKPVQPNSILRDAVASLQSWAKMKQITLVEESKDHLPTVSADVDRVTQVLVNFISNAIKFTPAQGKITVRAQAVGNSYLKVSVSDTGRGMSKQEQDHLFEKFYQTKQLSKSDQPGTGLGLFIAKSIVEMHKGQIGLESAEGKGTTFYFTLPVAAEPVKEIVKEAAPAKADQKRGWLSRLFHSK